MTEPLDWARAPVGSLADVRLRKRMRTWETVNERQGRTITAKRQGDEFLLEAWAGDMPQARTLDSFLDHPGLTEQIAAAFGFNPRPWRVASVREALGVPAIFRAASLIANLTGSLSMRALKNEVQTSPQDRPAIIVRPDPNRTPRDFYRDTAWNLAKYGEAWWFVSGRDSDRVAKSLYNVPSPAEVQVERDPKDPIRPIITWRNRSTRDGTLRREDMRQLTFLLDDEGLRGLGPLQLCGAAVSVAVESQEWAANFFAAGGYPNIWIKAAGDLSGSPDGWSTEDQTDVGAESEIMRLKEQWISTAPNTPKITDEGIIDIKQFDVNAQGAQMLDARNANNGDAARMFGVPGSLLEFQQEGSSLTYQNLEGEFTKMVRGCLRPGYLEPIEQTMTDLLVRSIVSRFNTEPIENPDMKTRYEVYGLGIDKGIIDVAYAQAKEGLLPGDVENAPVPLPLAVPSIPLARADSGEVRCDGLRTRRRGGIPYIAKCDKLLASNGVFVGHCSRCKKQYPPEAA